MTQRCIAGGIWSKTISPKSRSSAPSPRDTTRQSKASAPTSTLPLRSSPQGKCQQTLNRAPKILVLDKGTAHLDIEKERQINERLRALDMTRVSVAHRAEFAGGADAVLRIGNVHE